MEPMSKLSIGFIVCFLGINEEAYVSFFPIFFPMNLPRHNIPSSQHEINSNVSNPYNERSEVREMKPQNIRTNPKRSEMSYFSLNKFKKKKPFLFNPICKKKKKKQNKTKIASNKFPSTAN